jgi:hypothetical protein
MEWQDIDSAPIDGRSVLVYDGDWESQIFLVQMLEREVDSWGLYSNSIDPTHWMPLPPPPHIT